jgi:peptidoglycan/xylan/chitin deacetylase (PgdA/CDA1 family)
LFACSPRAALIHFDDAYDDTYTVAFPLLTKYGIPATVHVITGNVGAAGSCSVAQLQEMKAAGWTLDSHTVTHPDLTTKNEAEQITELKDSRDWLKARGFDYDLFASPSGMSNATTLTLLDQYGYRIHRNYLHAAQIWPIANRYALNCQGVNHDDTVEAVEAFFDTPMTDYQVVGVAFHHISDGAAATEWSIANFTALVEYLVDKHYPFYTLAELTDALEYSRCIGSVERFVTASTTTIAGITAAHIGSDHEGANHFDGAYRDFFVTGDLLAERELAARWGCRF